MNWKYLSKLKLQYQLPTFTKSKLPALERGPYCVMLFATFDTYRGKTSKVRIM